MNKYDVYTDSLNSFRVEADYFTKVGGDCIFFKEPASPSDQAFVALVRDPFVILKVDE